MSCRNSIGTISVHVDSRESQNVVATELWASCFALLLSGDVTVMFQISAHDGKRGQDSGGKGKKNCAINAFYQDLIIVKSNKSVEKTKMADDSTFPLLHLPERTYLPYLRVGLRKFLPIP